VWEVYTGRHAHAGLHYGSVVERVIVRGGRPPVPADMSREYALLMTSCWAEDPRMRPTFLQVAQCLRLLLQGLRGSSSSSSSSSGASGSSSSNSGEKVTASKGGEETVARVLAVRHLPARIDEDPEEGNRSSGGGGGGGSGSGSRFAVASSMVPLATDTGGRSTSAILLHTPGVGGLSGMPRGEQQPGRWPDMLSSLESEQTITPAAAGAPPGGGL
jgi:Protein tyrosine and serine/threonine kinase